MSRKLLLITLILLSLPLLQASTIHGSIYNSNLELENNILVEIDGQKLLSKDGTFSFEVSPGTYTIKAKKGLTEISEEVIVKDEKVVHDLFLLSLLSEENELWQEHEDDYFSDISNLAYWIAGIIFLFTALRLWHYRKKYGPLRKFRKKIETESKKTIEEHKEDLANEPGLADKALEVIKKHDGRISQKQLRKEMMYLSEAKVSLILTELEHNDKIEKVKKGRGNVILLK